MQHAIQHVRDLITQVKGRPRMHLERRSLRDLVVYLSGFCLGIDTALTVGPYSSYAELGRFGDWLRNRFGANKRREWADVLLEASGGNDEAAFDEFFARWEEFVREHGFQIQPPSNTEAGSRQPLQGIVARELSAVSFVRRFVELHFDGPMIGAYTLPTVTIAASDLVPGTPGYRDALCSCIGATVSAADVQPGLKLQIAFGDDRCVSVSLRPEDRQAQEAAIYTEQDPKRWAVW